MRPWRGLLLTWRFADVAGSGGYVGGSPRRSQTAGEETSRHLPGIWVVSKCRSLQSVGRGSVDAPPVVCWVGRRWSSQPRGWTLSQVGGGGRVYVQNQSLRKGFEKIKNLGFPSHFLRIMNLRRGFIPETWGFSFPGFFFFFFFYNFLF